MATTRRTITIEFDATPDEAHNLTDALREAILDSDALPVFEQVRVNLLAESVWCHCPRAHTHRPAPGCPVPA